MKYRELVLEDFRPINLGGGLSYLTARIGWFEVTIEEHLTAGYTVGIFDQSNKFLALEKKAYFMRNHPAGKVPDAIPGRIMARAISIANMLVQKYSETDASQWHAIPKRPTENYEPPKFQNASAL